MPQAEASTSSSSNFALFRPLESAEDSRIAFYLPDDEDVATAYSKKRREGKNVDELLVEQLQKGLTDDQVEEAKQSNGEEEEPVSFTFVYVEEGG